MSNPGELRHTFTVDDVGVALTEAGVPRSRRQIIRYCETQMLEAVKVPGPSGEQWYIAPASVPKVVGDLKQWEAQRAGHGAPRHTVSDPVAVESQPNTNPDAARHGEPWHAMAGHVTPEVQPHSEFDIPGHGATEPDMSNRVAPEVEPRLNHDEGGHGTPRHAVSDLPNHDAPRPGLTDLDIFAHPYVMKLEAQVEKLEGKLDAQVRRTEDIQIHSQQALIELQRMVAVGQSETLANFMLKAREWVLGKPTEAPDPTDDARATQ